MNNKILKTYEFAKERYAEMGVDTDIAVQKLLKKPISFNAWQLDDDKGFLKTEKGTGGGVMATGNYPGVAKTPEQLSQDAQKVFSLIPGKNRLSIQAKMLDASSDKIDLDRIEKKHYQSYVDWAKDLDIGLDFNPSCSGHPMANSGFTLSSRDNAVRDFWIEHFKRTSEIAEYFGEATGKRCITNYWIPDGYKDMPVDMYSPRERLVKALDEVFSRPGKKEFNINTLESKLFGIGLEAYTVGSHEFYMAYAAKNNLPLCLDAGHFHLSEDISNKISSLMFMCDEILLHVTRPMRWDSDHVVSFDDNTQNMMSEIVRNNWLERVNLGTDYFDASINRIAAGVIGLRNTQKALLKALLEPTNSLREFENEGNYAKRLALMEEMKTMPFAAVWDYVCEIENVPVGMDWYLEIEKYEKEVLSKR